MSSPPFDPSASDDLSMPESPPSSPDFRDPVCRLCSKSIQSRELVVYEHGEFFHIHCRSQALRMQGIESVAYAQAIRAKAPAVAHTPAALLEQPHPTRLSGGACAFCGRRTTVMDWRPSVPWLAIDGCRCDGYFLWTGLVTARLTQLTADDRTKLALRIMGLRAAGHEAWCTTEGGTEDGPIIVRTERPDRPT